MTSFDALMHASVMVSSREQLLTSKQSDRLFPKSHLQHSRNVESATQSLKPSIGSLPSMQEFLKCSQHRQPCAPSRHMQHLNLPTMHTTTRKQAFDTKLRERWTEKEHSLFMEGLLTYGRKWKKIQGLVGTKTVVQVRTHAYGYFAKLLRNFPDYWRSSDGSATCRAGTRESGGQEIPCMTPEDEHRIQVLERFVFRDHIFKRLEH
ncbi:unnamed protein product [Albugo candida]|uniref:HTH myb-type domain-containing protein n=1 Tax=Albugo candida TaxID=65357 RepID=A0A024G6R8_9STRA|nr:unnamed protein product [Albugo candida]|eukprot:CCI42353.1 unnamed protein product [Albugo candida]